MNIILGLIVWHIVPSGTSLQHILGPSPHTVFKWIGYGPAYNSRDMQLLLHSQFNSMERQRDHWCCKLSSCTSWGESILFMDFYRCDCEFLLWDLVRFERMFPELDQQNLGLLPYEI